MRHRLGLQVLTGSDWLTTTPFNIWTSSGSAPSRVPANGPAIRHNDFGVCKKKIADDARKLESKLWADFERNAPRILGSLYTAVAHGLKALPDTALERMPRMADFAAWIAACEGALWKKGTFMAAYAGNIEEAIETVLEADQIATSLRSYMDTLPADLFLAQAPPFTGTAAELLKAINATVPESQQKAKGWPKRTAELAKVLRRVAPPLRKVGIEIAFERKGKSGVRKITLTQPDRVGKTPSAPSAPSAVNEINNMRLTAGDEAAVSQGNGAVSPGPNGPRADSRADSSHEAGVSRNQSMIAWRVKAGTTSPRYSNTSGTRRLPILSLGKLIKPGVETRRISSSG